MTELERRVEQFRRAGIEPEAQRRPRVSTQSDASNGTREHERLFDGQRLTSSEIAQLIQDNL